MAAVAIYGVSGPSSSELLAAAGIWASILARHMPEASQSIAPRASFFGTPAASKATHCATRCSRFPDPRTLPRLLQLLWLALPTLKRCSQFAQAPPYTFSKSPSSDHDLLEVLTLGNSSRSRLNRCLSPSIALCRLGRSRHSRCLSLSLVLCCVGCSRCNVGSVTRKLRIHTVLFWCFLLP